MLAFIGAWILARLFAFIVFVVLLLPACILYTATEFLGTPNIEWLMDKIYQFATTPIIDE